MQSIFFKATACLDLKKPFILYVKPHSDVLIAFFQQNNELFYTDDLSERGFVFSSFLDNKSILFSEDKCEVVTECLHNELLDFPEFTDRKPTHLTAAFHMDLVKKGVAAIQSGKIDKVVLSRREEVGIDDSKILVYYQRIIQAYSAAFRYFFYHPLVGMWMGATPEQLIKNTKGKLETVALAGTQVYEDKENVLWQPKEQLEQEIVTDFILDSLSPYVVDLSKTLPYTFKAGTLIHIKTDISANLMAKNDFVNVVKALHPTPALCGFPKEHAKDFIVENEGYPREFYAGFLGEINYDYADNKAGNSDLFVNLRCMKLVDNTAFLYIGGGITKDSDPEKEFIETINKSKTMKKVLG